MSNVREVKSRKMYRKCESFETVEEAQLYFSKLMELYYGIRPAQTTSIIKRWR